MIALQPSHGLLAGLALILLSNAVALAGVWYNRQGEPESRLLLSERELHRDWEGPHRENSGLGMRLDWRMPLREANEENRCHNDHGLSAAQLQAVGLPSAGPAPRRDIRQAWAILELDGAAYQHSLRQAEQRLQQAGAKLERLPDDQQLQQQAKAARATLADERNKESRLFLVDVGLDADALRQRYPDRSRHALIRGTVRVWQHCYDAGEANLSGTFDPSNDRINVPHAFRPLLAERLSAYYANSGQPFTAEIRFGQRLEPWLSAVQVPQKPAAGGDDGTTAR